MQEDKHKVRCFFFCFFFYQLLLSLPRISLVHLIIMYDFEYNILIITIYNTAAKLFLCKVQRAKFVFVLVKACSCIVQLFSGVWNVLSTPRNAISQIFTPIFVSCFVSCNVIDKEFYNSEAFENSRYICTIPIKLYTVLINKLFIILKMLIITTQQNVYIITKKLPPSCWSN